MLIVALGLGALLWSCEDEQTGYEVAVPLIGPLEFNETSCDISGDICSTDDDCVDEDGFFTGPCTKTLTPIEPITVAVSLTPSTPSYTLPALETGRWLSPLATLQNTDTNPIVLTTENFSITGGPVTLLVEPFSRIGLYRGHDFGYEPVSVSSCTFTLDDSATGQDYADGISTCLRDWVKENGAPLEFDIRVTSSAGASAKSGFGLKQQGNYMVTGGDKWDTANRCEGHISTEVLEAVGEGSDFFSFLTCKNLNLTGSGWTDQKIEIWGVAEVYDRCGNYLATGSLGSTVKETVTVGPNDEDSPFLVDVYESEDFAIETNVVPVVFEPDEPDEPGSETFVKALLSAAAGECKSGTPVNDPISGVPLEMGYAVVDWNHCLPKGVELVERNGAITVTAEGFCPVAEGSGTGGGSGQ
jgi:hypothetical protein